MGWIEYTRCAFITGRKTRQTTCKCIITAHNSNTCAATCQQRTAAHIRYILIPSARHYVQLVTIPCSWKHGCLKLVNCLSIRNTFQPRSTLSSTKRTQRNALTFKSMIASLLYEDLMPLTGARSTNCSLWNPNDWPVSCVNDYCQMYVINRNSPALGETNWREILTREINYIDEIIFTLPSPVKQFQ